MFQKLSGFIVEENGVRIELVGYDEQVEFDCRKHCSKESIRDCRQRKKSNYSYDNQKLFFSYLLFEVCNFGKKELSFCAKETHIVTSDGYDMDAIGPCFYFESPRVKFDSYITIAPMTRIKACVFFPELVPNTFITRVYNNQREEGCLKFDFKLKDLTGEFAADVEKVQKNDVCSHKDAALLSKYEKRLSVLEHLIFKRLNNVLLKREKIDLENSIMNEQDQIERGTSCDFSSESLKQVIREKLSKIIDDYREAMLAKGERVLEWHERISKEGEREDLGNVYFRSSWEANVARVLNRRKISWQYEEKSANLGDVNYLPDFVLDDGRIIEVKGFWDRPSIEKCDAYIREYGPESIFIVDSDMYHDLEIVYRQSGAIENWEKESPPSNAQFVSIVGMRFTKDPTIISRLSIGQTLCIEKESDNKSDPYAILVKTQDGEVVGHFEKQMASLYTQKLNLGMTFDVIIKSIEKNVLKASVQRSNLGWICLPGLFCNGNS
ncbi:MAG: HIRAN domain-containing protein [Bacteroidales bacterium]|nr:HIRAN domain-containing protein [Bacteroidales bacterium]